MHSTTHSSRRDVGREVFRLNADIRVVIADDHDLFREGLAALLGLERGIRVVGEAGTDSKYCASRRICWRTSC